MVISAGYMSVLPLLHPFYSASPVVRKGAVETPVSTADGSQAAQRKVIHVRDVNVD